MLKKIILKIITLCENTLNNFDKPFKSTINYMLLNIFLCSAMAIAITLLTWLVYSDICINFLSIFFDNLKAYSGVIVYSFVCFTFLIFYMHRKNTHALITAFIIKLTSSAYMISLVLSSISKLIVDNDIYGTNDWVKHLPYEPYYPWAGIITLLMVWAATWYVTLMQRKILKKENPDYEDVYDKAKNSLQNIAIKLTA